MSTHTTHVKPSKCIIYIVARESKLAFTTEEVKCHTFNGYSEHYLTCISSLGIFYRVFNINFLL